MIDSMNELSGCIASGSTGSLTVVASRPAFAPEKTASQLAGLIAETEKKELYVFSFFQLAKVWDDLSIGLTPTIVDSLELMDISLLKKALMKDSVVVIDYLQLLVMNQKFRSRREEELAILGELKDLAYQIRTHVVVPFHLNRGFADNEGGKPLLTGNRLSANDQLCKELVDRSDCVLLLWRKHDCYRNIGVAYEYNIEGPLVVRGLCKKQEVLLME